MYSLLQAVVVIVVAVTLRIVSIQSKLGSDEGAIAGAVFPTANQPPAGVAADTLRNAPQFPQPKEEWSRRTWSDAQDIENAIYLRNKRFQPGMCKICDKPFGNLASHLAGQNHYNKIYAYVNGQWPLQDEEPPYQCWVFSCGSHHFLEHLTMQYRVVEDIPSILQSDSIIQRSVSERKVGPTRSDPNPITIQPGIDQDEPAVSPPPHGPTSTVDLPADADACADADPGAEAEADDTEPPIKGDVDSPTFSPLPDPPHHSTSGRRDASSPPESHFEKDHVFQITETFESDSKNDATVLYRGEHVRVVRIDNDGDLLVITHNVLYDDKDKCVKYLNVAGRRTGELNAWIKSKHLDKVRFWMITKGRGEYDRDPVHETKRSYSGTAGTQGSRGDTSFTYYYSSRLS
ncbi:hypothetical protein N9L68_04235 [bacterium]|nr:hypothetical protein [bacterium]